MVNSASLPYAIDASNLVSRVAPAGIKNAFRESMLEIRQVWVDQVNKAKKGLERGRREVVKEVEKPPQPSLLQPGLKEAAKKKAQERKQSQP
jgi:hypothetical protein